METDFPLKFQKGMQPDLHVDFSFMRLSSEKELSHAVPGLLQHGNSEIISGCYLKPLRLL